MFTADKWKSYEVIDTGNGEKLERWGKYILRRPDPQVIWPRAAGKKEWSNVNAHYHRSKKGGGEWEFFDLPQTWSIDYDLASGHPGEGGFGSRLTFLLKPFAFKHTGIFPEQAANWEWFYPLIRNSVSSGKKIKVLNLFAYTGGASLAAAAAGAAVTHVDASKGMVGWAKENAAASGLGDAPIRYLVDDCIKFVERETRRGNTYDGIIMDPPSYGKGPGGEVWKMEDNVYSLIEKCRPILSEKPLFFLISSYTTGLQSSVLSYMLSRALGDFFDSPPVCDEVGLPVTRTGLILPCGASGRMC